MRARRERVERLLGLRERALEAARVELAAAARAASEAAEVAALSERAYGDEAARCAAGAFATVDALIEAHAHVAALRSRADADAARVEKLREAEAEAREACVRAERERRKLEIWREKLVEVERAAENRKERVATDEVAARTFVRSHA
jgi:flagellar export protein FliJ